MYVIRLIGLFKYYKAAKRMIKIIVIKGEKWIKRVWNKGHSVGGDYNWVRSFCHHQLSEGNPSNVYARKRKNQNVQWGNGWLNDILSHPREYRGW